jgi:non-heme chloroperoxidase
MSFFKPNLTQPAILPDGQQSNGESLKRRTLFKSLFFLGTAAIGGNTAQAASTVENAKKIKRGGPFIDAPDGTSLFYQDWGEGSPVVFAAPCWLTSNWWEYQTPYLTDQGLRCITYDRRGHGRSDMPCHGYDFDTLAGDLDAIIRQLDLRNVTLVGHSMGCAEAVRYLSRFGANRVARLVLIATITPFVLKTEDNPLGIERSELETARMNARKDRAHVVAEAAASFFGAPKIPVSDEIMQWWDRMLIDQTPMITFLRLHQSFTETDFRPDLQKITVPTLLIHGDADTSSKIELTSRRSAPMIRGSQFKVYEGAAHGLPVTHMDRLNADLLAFVKN